MCALKDQAGGLACRRRAGGRLEVGDVAPPEVDNEAAGGMSIGAASLSLPCDFLVRGMSSCSYPFIARLLPGFMSLEAQMDLTEGLDTKQPSYSSCNLRCMHTDRSQRRGPSPECKPAECAFAVS